VKKYFPLILCWAFLFSSCGGGTFSGGASFHPAPVVTFSSAELTFGVEVVGSATQAQALTLTNSGAGPLSIVSVIASGDFQQTNNCASNVAAGAACEIDVIFRPSVSGVITGMLMVTDNASGSPQIVSLSGTGSVAGPRCSGRGQACSLILTPCCSGLKCTAVFLRAVCL
jgi:centrosomal CEP192-like protein